MAEIQHRETTTHHCRHRQTTAASINGQGSDQPVAIGQQDHEYCQYSRRLLRVVRKGSREPRVGCCTRSKRTLAQRKIPTLPAVRPRASLLQQPALRQRTARCCLRRHTQTSAIALCLGGLKTCRDIGSESFYMTGPHECNFVNSEFPRTGSIVTRVVDSLLY